MLNLIVYYIQDFWKNVGFVKLSLMQNFMKLKLNLCLDVEKLIFY